MSSGSSQFIREAALGAGFDLAGVAPVDDLPELAYLREWIAAGYAGDMGYLEARNQTGRLKRESLANVAPWARSAVVCGLNYNTGQPYSTEYSDSARGWISRYAWGSVDYHKVVMKQLRALEGKLRAEFGDDIQTRCYVDTGP